MKCVLTTTIKIKSQACRLLPVRTDKPISLEETREIMKAIANFELEAPIYVEEVVIQNVLGKKINLIATKTIEK
ncbi:MAG: DUF1667 domain-containing protein [Clostridia bacterium]|nr:DUF1667 domain-containing protein [Clostridia bacterium]